MKESDFVLPTGQLKSRKEAARIGFWNNQEYSSGTLNPKVVLGEMGSSGGKGFTETQVLGGELWKAWCDPSWM